MAIFGPKITARERSRFKAVAGKGLTKKYPDGTVVTFDTDPLMAYIADGFAEVATLIGERASANAPDDPFYVNEAGQRVRQPAAGFGLPTNWGVMAWVFGKLIYGKGASRADSKISKPRAFRTDQASAEAIVGFGFPGRFNELGTAENPARPFLGPAAMDVLGSGDVERVMRRHMPQKGDR